MNKRVPDIITTDWLKKMQIPEEVIEWFDTNIGTLDKQDVSNVTGDYIDTFRTIEWAMNLDTVLEYNPDGYIVKAGNKLECEYNKLGQCINMVYGLDRTLNEFKYDKDGNNILKLVSGVPIESNIYQDGKLYCRMTCNGVTILYEYDYLGRICKETKGENIYIYKYSDETTNITSCLKDGKPHWVRKYVMEANCFCQYLNGKIEVRVPIGGSDTEPSND